MTTLEPDQSAALGLSKPARDVDPETIDGTITDDPAMARGVIEQRGALSPAERLLLELADLFGVAPRIGEQ